MGPFLRHLNQAIITKTMLKMNKEEFIECASFIKKKGLELPPGTERYKYVRLFIWCRNHYARTYQSREANGLFSSFE